MHLTLSWDGRCASGPWYRAAGQNGDALSKLSELHRIDHSHLHISGHENKIMLVNIEQCAVCEPSMCVGCQDGLLLECVTFISRYLFVIA